MILIETHNSKYSIEGKLLQAETVEGRTLYKEIWLLVSEDLSNSDKIFMETHEQSREKQST